ncbi:MAG: MotA/TolQ/ExbB proton channel family protein [Candidatus Electrothrix aestuarii]|uniref:MotA/TolQ/ExbB proton channel family protein n=1 Tax=Candidatus Electrothrix aestuarii TaxID=3062594 RepID=A0AAU8LZ85_9BACT|nr:MotA/TolQ/ExbB proton channel family protein [Candidatus Electrothrix aestuarii]WPD23315.1 MAG: MotA/TolQ/ExbB proton channel family protein [Candidatus Electrothrix sp. GW3-3]
MLEIIRNGGLVMWPLLACSVIVLTIILERILFWGTMAYRRNRPLRDEVLHIAESRDWQQIEEKTEDSDDAIVRVLKVGILHRDYDMSKAMESEAQHLLKQMSQFMTVLDTIITVAPLLGILGTVIGIISSFKMLGSSGMADPKLVTGGIAQALITTAAGLTISIFTVFPYNYFKSRIENAAHLMEKYATRLEVGYRRLQAEGIQ